MLESIEKLREYADNVRNGRCDMEEAIVAQMIIANMNEVNREIAERYMELPVDADGVPIRPGDQMTDYSQRIDCLGLAKWDVVSVNECAFYDMSHDSHIGSEYHHVKPRTVEDVLREYGDAVDRLGQANVDMASYAAELQMRGAE